MRTVLLMSSPAMLGALACGPSAEEQQRAKTQAEFRDAFARRDPNAELGEEVSHPKRVMVARGRSPVVFDVRTAATAHVMDLTTGGELIAVAVEGDQWISVNEDNGVLVGSRRIKPGPLPEGHEFGILLDVGGDESFKFKQRTAEVPELPPTRIVDPTPAAKLAPVQLFPIDPAPPQQPAPQVPVPQGPPATQPAPVSEDSRSNS